MFKVYMDESGTHDGSPVVTVAAYLGRPREWREWTKKWKDALRPIKVFHAVDAQNLSGEFSEWRTEDVGDLVKKLLPIIAESEIAAIAVGMDLRAFEAAKNDREDLRSFFPTPYVACFQWAIQIILNLAFDAKNTDRIAFIHEINDYKSQALEAFSWIQQNGNRGSNLISLTFADKKDYPPLQAADILAYETNKRLRKPDAPARRPWAALRANTFAVHYGDKNMSELISTLEKIKAGKFDEVNRGLGWNRAWLEIKK